MASTEDKAAAAAERKSMVAALHEEREGYVRAGMTDRAKQVTEQIKLWQAGPPQDRQTTPQAKS